MPRIFALSSLSLVILAVTGCELGPALLRVSEVLIEYDNGTSTTREEVEYTYNSKGQIEEIERQQERDLIARYEYAYNADGKMIEAERTIPDQPRLTLDIEYRGDLLTEIEGSVDGERLHYELDYFEDDVRFLDEARVTVDTEDYTSTVDIDFGYDGESRLKSFDVRTRAVGKGVFSGNEATTSSSQKYRWDEQDRMTRVTVDDEATDGTRTTEQIDYSYHDNGVLKDADGDEGSRLRVKYDADDRIREIEMISSGTTITYEYTYAEGYTDGFVITSGIPGNFDLTGKVQKRITPYSDDLIPTP